MVMRKRPTFAFALATTVLLSACSAATVASPSAAEPSATTTPPSPTPSEPGCPYPDGAKCRGPLKAGGPYKANLFVPVFSLIAGNGWDNRVDNPNEYLLLRSGPDGQPTEMGIYIFRDVAIQAATCEDKPEPGIGRTAGDMTAHLRNHSGLVTTEPEPVNIGGLDGVVIEVTVAETWTETCHYSEGQPNVPLFWGSQADSGFEWGIGPGAKSRFYILDMPGGGNVLIDIASYPDATEFDALREAAVPVVDSIVFDPNYY